LPPGRYSFQERLCLIPVSAFAEAESEGRLPDEEISAVAGLSRDTPEWGFSQHHIMTEACIPVADVHDRTPVILKRQD
jgi:putative SOS response-associated peptidase YedK